MALQMRKKRLHAMALQFDIICEKFPVEGIENV
jgi:hypothetical protein